MFVPATINFDRAGPAGGDGLSVPWPGGEMPSDVIRLAHAAPVIKSVSILC